MARRDKRRVNKRSKAHQKWVGNKRSRRVKARAVSRKKRVRKARGFGK